MDWQCLQWGDQFSAGRLVGRIPSCSHWIIALNHSHVGRIPFQGSSQYYQTPAVAIDWYYARSEILFIKIPIWFLLSFFFFFFPFRFPLSFFLLLLFLFFFFSFLLSNLKVMLASYQVPHRSPVDERSPYSVLVSSAWGFKEAPKPTSEHHALLSSPQFFF